MCGSLETHSLVGKRIKYSGKKSGRSQTNPLPLTSLLISLQFQTGRSDTRKYMWRHKKATLLMPAPRKSHAILPELNICVRLLSTYSVSLGNKEGKHSLCPMVLQDTEREEGRDNVNKTGELALSV
jgi:hypothetical protein